ncbi:unnamed protein product [Acanthoscelides obtectus]|uniref:FAD synthase n=1 Tax=Acanthoscelides obtectus TaxID=200917 RepID=A0A9P0Q516_ACAOB|nr:unnamed protein product [Acanthoscelides obtectus]CAK1638781.1 FAD synthase [Acanthoscelides obtectus]
MNTVGILYVVNACDEKRHEKPSDDTVEYLTNELKSLNYTVEDIEIVKQKEQLISSTLQRFSAQFDVTIVISYVSSTSLFEALVKIMGADRVNGGKLCNLYDGTVSNCNLPAGVKLLSVDSLELPVVYFQRIFILNGEFLEYQFTKVVKDRLKVYKQIPSYSKVIKIKNHTNSNHSIESILNQLKTYINSGVAVKNYDSEIRIGSTFFENIVECTETLKKQLNEVDIQFEEHVGEDFSEIYESREAHIRQAIENIEECLRKYGPENVFVSFNGGKDCTVLLHLYYIVLKYKYPEFKEPIYCSYVKNSNVFPEQTEFIRQCKVYFNLAIEESSTVNMKEHLEHILKARPNLKACLMGTRRTDPYSEKLNIFELTDPDWPRIMRVSPLLDWHYSDIWDYLLFYKVPYCKLYDYGYTSLGDASSTNKNPALKCVNVKIGRCVYLPAYKLLNESKERIGRNKTVYD